MAMSTHCSCGLPWAFDGQQAYCQHCDRGTPHVFAQCRRCKRLTDRRVV